MPNTSPSQQRTRVLDFFERRPVPERVPAPDATASALLRRYRPLETRAAGGFGSVEICLDSRLQRRVAIKRIPLTSPDVRTTAETVADALAEARTASMLQHPNIVSVIDFTYDAAYAYLVMEYVDGMSLEEFLAEVDGHSLTYDEAACIADALVQALTFAHENGVLHLDIKPANVLIDRNGHVKLTDFGMATLTSAAGFGGARGGTIGYMPPEQLRGDEVDERTDIFALAAVIYEALCGTAPFRAATPADSESRIEQGVLYPSDLLPDIPENTEEALLCALSPSPRDRMTSVAAFGDLLLAGLGHAREGRKSLATMIARLTSDEADEDAEAPGRAERTWELDPTEGYLGSQTPHARRILTGLGAGLSVAFVSWALLALVGPDTAVARGAAGAAIGAAAGAAPQMGSALVITGLIVTALAGAPLLAALPVVVLALALGGAWWLVWGRLDAGASAALVIASALFAGAGDPVLAMPFAVTAAALLAQGPAAASAVALGGALGSLVAALGQTEGALGIAEAAQAVVNLPSLASLALGAAAAMGASAVLARAWQRYQDAAKTGGYVLASLVPAAATLVGFALAYPMEIPSLSPMRAATVAACGIASSIIVWIYLYLFGYRKSSTGV